MPYSKMLTEHPNGYQILPRNNLPEKSIHFTSEPPGSCPNAQLIPLLIHQLRSPVQQHPRNINLHFPHPKHLPHSSPTRLHSFPSLSPSATLASVFIPPLPPWFHQSSSPSIPTIHSHTFSLSSPNSGTYRFQWTYRVRYLIWCFRNNFIGSGTSLAVEETCLLFYFSGLVGKW